MAAWGTVEARLLGLYDLLLERCATEVRYLTYHVEGIGEPLDLPVGRAALRAVARVSSSRDAGGSDRGGCVGRGDGLATVEVGLSDAR